MTPTEEDLIEHIIELVIQVLVLYKVIRQGQVPASNLFPKKENPPWP